MRQKIWQYILNFISMFQVKVIVEPITSEGSSIVLRSYDTNKITRQDFDIIMDEYNGYIIAKKAMGADFQCTLDNVTIRINRALGYNKSRTSYSKIWSGSVSRESLGERVSV